MKTILFGIAAVLLFFRKGIWTLPLTLRALAIAALACVLIGYAKKKLRKLRYTRGRELLRNADAKGIASRQRVPNDAGIFFGGEFLPESAGHILLCGTTGAGKTICLNLLMRSVLPRIRDGADARALVYDAKQDVLSYLHALGLDCPIKTLSPFDRRSLRWDVAADCTTPATAQQIATTLIEEETGANRFFSDAARHILRGVILSFVRHSPRNWTFTDLVYAAKSKDRLREVLERDEEGRELIASYFEEERTWQNIFSTLQTRLSRYEPIAGAWARADKALSLREWIESESSVLVLGNDESIRGALDAINRVIFKRLQELLLAQSESSTRRTWIFLDEVREMGRVDGLSSLLLKGRSKGVCVSIGFQAIEGLRDVYGEHIASEIIGQCSNKALLRMESDKTAEWASKLVGQYETIEKFASESIRHKSMSEQRVKADVVMPSEFFTIPPTTRANGLTGYFLTPHIGVFKRTIPSSFISEWQVDEDLRTEKDFDPRPDSHQYVPRWSVEDRLRLGLTQELGCDKPERNGLHQELEEHQSLSA